MTIKAQLVNEMLSHFFSLNADESGFSKMKESRNIAI